jgi:hypothetical protein
MNGHSKGVERNAYREITPLKQVTPPTRFYSRFSPDFAPALP